MLLAPLGRQLESKKKSTMTLEKRQQCLRGEQDGSAGSVQSIPHGFIASDHPIRCRCPTIIIF